MRPESAISRLGEVLIKSTANSLASTAWVSLWWRGAMQMNHHRLSIRDRDTLPFAFADRDSEIRGRISLLPADPMALNLDLSHPGGEVQAFRLWPAPQEVAPVAKPAVPVVRTARDPSLLGESLSGPLAATARTAHRSDLEALTADAELFRFQILRPWMPTADTDHQNRFVSYPRDFDLDGDSLYCRLARIRRGGGDEAVQRMRGEAQAFVQGTRGHAGQYLEQIGHLPAPFRDLHRLASLIRADGQLEGPGLAGLASRVLARSWEQLRFELQGSECAAMLERCWQNFFAAVLIGSDRLRYNALVDTLVAAALLTRMARSEPVIWDARRIAEGAWASPVLPRAVFPIPAQRAGGFIKPYAMADLQAVRYRFARSQWGAPCGAATDAGDADEAATPESAQRATRDLEAALDRAFVQCFDSAAGTPHGPVDEALTAPLSMADGDAEQAPQQHAERVAQSVVGAALMQVESVVNARRAKTAVRPEQVAATHPEGDFAPSRASHRWIDQVYSAQTLRYGQRLVLELLVDEPATRYLRRQRRTASPASVARPVDPAELGLADYTSLSVDPQSPCYYATLASRYNAVEMMPPPVAERTICAAFRFGVAPAAMRVNLPYGYAARHATVTVHWGIGGTPMHVHGHVGGAAFETIYRSSHASDSRPVMPEPVVLNLNEATGSVETEMCISGDAFTSSLPPSWPYGPSRAPSHAGDTERSADAPRIAAPAEQKRCAATVQVTARCSDAHLLEWKRHAYRHIMDAYEAQQRHDALIEDEEWESAMDERMQDRLEEASQTVTQSLRRDVVDQFVAHAAAHGQAVAEPPADRVGVPVAAPAARQVKRFVNQSMEWEAMTITYTPGSQHYAMSPARDAVRGDLPREFFAARTARILLPVRPDSVMAVLGFLTSGGISPDASVRMAVHEGNVDIVNELKSAAPAAPGKRWEICVPTDVALKADGSDALPDAPTGTAVRPATR